MADDPNLLKPTDPILQDKAKYDAWFKKQVELGLHEADDPNTLMITHEEVMRNLTELRKEWKTRVEKQRHVA